MIIQGDCLIKLKELDAESIDAIVCDPPYNLTSIVERFGKEGSTPAQFGTDGAFARVSKGFMGKEWDGTGIAFKVELWQECLRVLKPGGHLIAFGGTRTYHRMAVAIEDAGFEVRDMLEWIYASGFPKSLNVGKAVDKICGETGRKEKFTQWMRTTGITASEINTITGTFMGSHYLTAKEQPAIPTAELWGRLRPHIKIEIPQWVDELVERIEREREVIGKQTNIANKGNDNTGRYNWNTEGQQRKESIDITKGNSEWEGFGTALKPAHEPIILARKPLSEQTIVENVLKYGTGALDIDGCRIPTSESWKQPAHDIRCNGLLAKKGRHPTLVAESNELGRFPANIICTDDALNDGVMTKGRSGAVNIGNVKFRPAEYGSGQKDVGSKPDCGSKSRYFDIDVWAEKHGLLQFPKASKSERNDGCEGYVLKNNVSDEIVKEIKNLLSI